MSGQYEPVRSIRAYGHLDVHSTHWVDPNGTTRDHHITANLPGGQKLRAFADGRAHGYAIDVD